MKILLSLCLLGLALKARPQDVVRPRESPFFPLKVGTTWTYKVGPESIVQRVSRREKVGEVECVLIETFHDQRLVTTEHLASGDDGIYRYTYGGERLQPPVRILKLPPKRGDQWTVDSKIGGQPVKATFTLSEADITVPAGRFKTVVSTAVADGSRISMGCWFAEGVGLVRQTFKSGDREVVFELERVDLAR